MASSSVAWRSCAVALLCVALSLVFVVLSFFLFVFGRDTWDGVFHPVPWGIPVALDYKDQPFITAVATGNHHGARELLAKGADVNAKYGYPDEGRHAWFLPIHLACKTGDTEMVKVLVGAGADPNAEDFLGDSAIVEMSRNESFTPGNAEVLPCLAKLGANLDAPCLHGYSALDVAVLEDHLAFADALLRLGANVNVSDSNGDTPLITASRRIPQLMPNPATIALLLRHGADPSIKNHDSKTAADYLRDRGLEHLLKMNGKTKGTGDVQRE